MPTNVLKTSSLYLAPAINRSGLEIYPAAAVLALARSLEQGATDQVGGTIAVSKPDKAKLMAVKNLPSNLFFVDSMDATGLTGKMVGVVGVDCHHINGRPLVGWGNINLSARPAHGA